MGTRVKEWTQSGNCYRVNVVGCIPCHVTADEEAWNTRADDPFVTARFWTNVDKDRKGCWVWKDHRDPKGYGLFKFRGKTRTAHRIAFQLLIGDPEGYVIAHRCDNPPCVNPSHLFATDMQGNAMDMQLKNRAHRALGISASKYKGLTFRESRGKWLARTMHEGVTYNIGSFISEIEAAKAYDDKVYSIHGDKAVKILNFPERYSLQPIEAVPQ